MLINLPALPNRMERLDFVVVRFVVSAMMAFALTACTMGETYTRGQAITPDQLEQVPSGSSREQVLVVLGTPTTTGLAGGEVFYYISQTSGRSLAFQRPSVRDRRILAIYFNENSEVRELGEYGLKDGRVFNYLTRKTRTSGADLAFVTQLLGGLMNPGL